MIKKRIITLLLVFCIILPLPLPETKAATVLNEYNFFYNQLSAEAKTIYNNLLKSDNIVNMKNGKTIHAWSSQEHTFTSEENFEVEYDYWWKILFPQACTYVDALFDAYQILYLDHIELFWAGCIHYGISIYVKDGNSFRVCTETENNAGYQIGKTYQWNVDVTFDVLEPWSKGRSITSDEAFISNKVTEIVNNIDKSKNYYSQLLQVHDWLTMNNSYNLAAANGNSSDGNIPWTALSAFSSTFNPVCQGYSIAFKMICDRLGIPCVLVSGYGNSKQHMWNYVKMEDGKWYAVDVTWNDPVFGSQNSSGMESHEYFMVGSDTVIDGTKFSESHKIDNFKNASGISFKWPSLSSKAYSCPVTITFDSQGGTPSAPQTIQNRELVIKPEPPTNNGYKFNGWYTDKECTSLFDFEIPVYSSLTLYAGWTKNLSLIVEQPKNFYVYDHYGFPTGTAEFKILAQGDNLTYQWEESADGGITWEKLSYSTAGFNKDTLSINFTHDKENYQYRCIVKDKNGVEEKSDTAKIIFGHENTINIVEQPKDFYAYDHYGFSTGTAEFKISAQGDNLTYQWEESTDGGITWEKLSYSTAGFNKDTLLINFIHNKENYQYRCVVKGKNETKVISNAAKIIFKHENTIKIITQPKDFYVYDHYGFPTGTAEFKISAQGDNLTYQWEESTDGGITWEKLLYSTAGFNKDTLSINFIHNKENYQYRCIVKDKNGAEVISNAAKIIFKYENTIKIITQPEHFYVYDHYTFPTGTAEFKISAQGDNLTYQWEESTDGGITWKKLLYSTVGFNKDTLSINFIHNKENYQYRCVLKDKNGAEVISNVAKIIFDHKNSIKNVKFADGVTTKFDHAKAEIKIVNDTIKQLIVTPEEGFKITNTTVTIKDNKICTLSAPTAGANGTVVYTISNIIGNVIITSVTVSTDEAKLIELTEKNEYEANLSETFSDSVSRTDKDKIEIKKNQENIYEAVRNTMLDIDKVIVEDSSSVVFNNETETNKLSTEEKKEIIEAIKESVKKNDDGNITNKIALSLEVKTIINDSDDKIVKQKESAKTMIKNKNSNAMVNATLYPFDISLFAKVIGNTPASNAKIKLKDTKNGVVHIKMKRPSNIIKQSDNVIRKYYMVLFHEVKGSETIRKVIDVTENKDDDTLSFKSNLFSTYILVYTDTPKIEKPDSGQVVITSGGSSGGNGASSGSSPTATPSIVPTITPSIAPTATPSAVPTSIPSIAPTATPSIAPTATPSVAPTATPSVAPTATPILKIKLGQKVTTDVLQYKVTSVNGSRTVTVTGIKNSKNAIIPANITISKKVYKVTAIANNAFKDNKKIIKIKVGKNISKIGKNAFKGCVNVKKIVIKTTKLKANKVGKNAFKGINKKAIIKIPKRKSKEYKKIISACGIVKSMKIKTIL